MSTTSTGTVAPTDIEDFSERVLNTFEDRCDRCGVEAWFVCTSPTVNPRSGERSEILFCKNHGEKHVPALREKNFSILDFSEQMYEKFNIPKTLSDGDVY